MSSESIEKARASALRLIKFRPRSVAELRIRLAQRGFSSQLIEALTEEFKHKGFLDDAKVARYLANQRMLTKPTGRQTLLRMLSLKGIETQLATLAVQEATQEMDELEMARAQARERLGRLKGLPKASAERRLHGFLLRRGFSSEVVYKILREISRELSA